MREQASFIREYTERAAPDQLARYRQPSARRDQKLARLFALAGDVRGKRVLDLGCSIGAVALECARRGAHAVAGLDYTPRMIELARELAREQGAANAEFVVGDVSQRNFDAESFDLVLAADIVEHLYPEILERALAETLRVLRPGGRLVVHTTPTFYQYVFTSLPVYLPLVPMALLPGRWQDRVLAVYYRTALQGAHWLARGETYDRHVARRAHCNPQTPAGFAASLRAAGFRVAYCAAEELPADRENRAWRWASALFRRCSHLRWHLFAVAERP